MSPVWLSPLIQGRVGGSLQSFPLGGWGQDCCRVLDTSFEQRTTSLSYSNTSPIFLFARFYSPSPTSHKVRPWGIVAGRYSPTQSNNVQNIPQSRNSKSVRWCLILQLHGHTLLIPSYIILVIRPASLTYLYLSVTKCQLNPPHPKIKKTKNYETMFTSQHSYTYYIPTYPELF